MQSSKSPSSLSEYLELSHQYRDYDIKDASKIIEKLILQYTSLSSNLPMVIAVLDYTKKKYIHISNSIKDLLGYSSSYIIDGGMDLVASAIYHKHDLSIFTEKIFIQNLEFLKTQPVETHKDFVFSYNWRAKNKNGDYITFLQRQYLLQSAPDGSPLLMLNFSIDISDFYDNDKKIIHTIGYANDLAFPPLVKNIFFPDQKKTILSKREIEILKWICNGYSSKQLADKMHLSIHTINNHRKHMLEKTNCKNSAELLHFALKYGLL